MNLRAFWWSLVFLVTSAAAAAALPACGSSKAESSAAGGASGASGTTGPSSGHGGGGSSTASAAGGNSAGGSDAGGPITTQPTNILRNGGFETGLMCFGTYDQSTSGTDYGYFLSSDAHSGDYALEIRCIGSTCADAFIDRAFVITLPFHMPASQDYALSVWAKCPAGGDAFWYTPSVPSGNQSQSLQCTGDWALNQMTFTSPATDGEGYFYFYNHTTGSLFLDDVVLTYGDGTVPPHTVKHPGTRSVVAKTNHVEVDGAPYLALGFFDVPFDALPIVAAIPGANFVTTAGGSDVGDCFNTDRETYPDRARELGLDVAPATTGTAELSVPGIFPAVMTAYAPYLANIGIYLADEPDLSFQQELIDPTVLAAERAAAHTVTSLPLLADLQHAHYDPPAVDQPYQDGEDIYGSEPYGDGFGGVTNSFTVFATMTPRPVWLFDTNHTDPTTVVPKAYFSIVSGATGLAFFTWGSISADAGNLAAFTQAIGELSQLSGPIFGTDVTPSVTAPAGISFIARQAGGKTYVLAVSPSASPRGRDGERDVRGPHPDRERRLVQRHLRRRGASRVRALSLLVAGPPRDGDCAAPRGSGRPADPRPSRKAERSTVLAANRPIRGTARGGLS
jgi:hypothetical protein